MGTNENALESHFCFYLLRLYSLRQNRSTHCSWKKSILNNLLTVDIHTHARSLSWGINIFFAEIFNVIWIEQMTIWRFFLFNFVVVQFLIFQFWLPAIVSEIRSNATIKKQKFNFYLPCTIEKLFSGLDVSTESRAPNCKKWECQWCNVLHSS